METVTISLDHYLELVRLQFRLEELQDRLNKEILRKDDILSALNLDEKYYKEYAATYLEKESKANG